jgi:RNA polymerase sigma-54 factor
MKSRQSISQNTSQRLTLHTGLLTSIRLLKTDASGLSRYLEEHAAENPHLVVERRGHSDWLPRWRDAFRSIGGGGLPDEIENVAGAGPSLMGHVMDAIDAMGLSRREQAIAEALADALEPSGWISRPLGDIAGEARASLPEVEAVLARLQKIEPIGLFARNLSECLALQARETGELDTVLEAILKRLDLLAQGDFGRLARSIGISEVDVTARLRVIRSFDPKPGSQFSAFAAPTREPDLVVQKGADGWVVALNRSALPDLRLADLPKGTAGQRAEARNLIKLVEGRNATLLKVAGAILKHQTAALERGPQMLAPMTMAEIAAEVGLAQSTVSRIVAGTAVDTPQGTWWLRALFSQAKDEGGQSAAALRERLARLVGTEDSAGPLSDAALAAALSSPGFDVARRTVAKYRTMLGIPPAHRRKRIGEAGAARKRALAKGA